MEFVLRVMDLVLKVMEFVLEIAQGDEFFSPFIAPGWSEREEMNLRPAQTLGILKALFVVGAEYIHVSIISSSLQQLISRLL